jgi:hypothetical protein
MLAMQASSRSAKAVGGAKWGGVDAALPSGGGGSAAMKVMCLVDMLVLVVLVL